MTLTSSSSTKIEEAGEAAIERCLPLPFGNLEMCVAVVLENAIQRLRESLATAAAQLRAAADANRAARVARSILGVRLVRLSAEPLGGLSRAQDHNL